MKKQCTSEHETEGVRTPFEVSDSSDFKQCFLEDEYINCIGVDRSPVCPHKYIFGKSDLG